MPSRTGIELLPHVCRIVEVASRARLFGGASARAAARAGVSRDPVLGRRSRCAHRRAARRAERTRAPRVGGRVGSAKHAPGVPVAAGRTVPTSKPSPAGRRAPPRAACPRRPSPTRSSQARCVTGAARPAMPPSRPLNSCPAAAAPRRRRHGRVGHHARPRARVARPAAQGPPSGRRRRGALGQRAGDGHHGRARRRSCCSRANCRGATRPMGASRDRDSAAARRVHGARSPPNSAARWSTCASSQKVDVCRVLVCGDLVDLRSLTGPLVNELALDVETLDVGEDLDLSKLPEPSDSFRSRLGAWRTALALAADAVAAARPEPRATRGRRRRLSALLPRVAAAAVAGALIVAAGWGALGYLSAGVTARQERLRRTIGVLEPELQRQDEERRRAAVAAAREAALAAFASQGPRLARVLEAFGAATPADVAISSIRVEPGVASWRLVVEGQAEGPTPGPRTRRSTSSSTRSTRRRSSAIRPRRRRCTHGHRIPPKTSDSGRPRLRQKTRRRPAAAPRDAAALRDGPVVHRSRARRPALPDSPAAEHGQPRSQPRGRTRPADGRRPRSHARRPPHRRRRPVTTAPGAPGRHPASVVAFTLRYEVPK